MKKRKNVDLLWAVASALLAYRLYRSAGLSTFDFVEEILPGADVIPSATLGRFYFNYLRNTGKKQASALTKGVYSIVSN